MDTALDTHLAHAALEAASAAAPYLRAHVRQGTSFDTKHDFHDPVTIHDKAVEAALHHLLGVAVPGSHVLGEETGETVLTAAAHPARPEVAPEPTSSRWCQAVDALDGLADRVRWIVDPIDGTSNFACGMPWFCTSIGVELDGQRVAGAIVAPMLREAWVADSTRAWYEDGQGNVRELDAKGATSEREAVLICYYPGPSLFGPDPHTVAERFARIVHAHQSTRRTGASALDLAHVASGWLGGMMGFSFGPWDMAAGTHIVEVAGGSIEDVDPEGVLPHGLRPVILAAGAGLDLATAREVMGEVVADLSSR
ncbi:inositol monophosphatase [Schaalia sp. 19OD2882]|uniref:inositol monophosphatase family protein n=1 Tax=Schaalia sp. 19OD2882 TaxID=2794089 RepID=UPI001C1EFC67|nr:inositol monophosphatase [Schaalia sp. 19OD2882]QWW18827.1 inositol monophosphatase [Schaalia sp. 19OD2882]